MRISGGKTRFQIPLGKTFEAFFEMEDDILASDRFVEMFSSSLAKEEDEIFDVEENPLIEDAILVEED